MQKTHAWEWDILERNQALFNHSTDEELKLPEILHA